MNAAPECALRMPSYYGLCRNKYALIAESLRKLRQRGGVPRHVCVLATKASEVLLALHVAIQILYRAREKVSVDSWLKAVTGAEDNVNRGWKCLRDNVMVAERKLTLKEEDMVRNETGYDTDMAIDGYRRMLECKNHAVGVLSVMAGVALVRCRIDWFDKEDGTWKGMYVQSYNEESGLHTLVGVGGVKRETYLQSKCVRVLCTQTFEFEQRVSGGGEGI